MAGVIKSLCSLSGGWWWISAARFVPLGRRLTVVAPLCAGAGIPPPRRRRSARPRDSGRLLWCAFLSLEPHELAVPSRKHGQPEPSARGKADGAPHKIDNARCTLRLPHTLTAAPAHQLSCRCCRRMPLVCSPLQQSSSAVRIRHPRQPGLSCLVTGACAQGPTSSLDCRHACSTRCNREQHARLCISAAVQ